MGSFSFCLVSLLTTSSYVMIFIFMTIYLLIINRCKFNKRTKVVISILACSMSLQLGSTLLAYMNELKEGECSVYPLAYTMQAYQHVIILIIYSFLVARMLAIYFKMSLAT